MNALRRALVGGVGSLLAIKVRSSVGVLCAGAFLVSGASAPAAQNEPKGLSPVEVVKVQLDKAASEALPAGISVDLASETYLAITVTDRDGGLMALDFVPNEGSDILRPVLPEKTESAIFGADMQLKMFLGGLTPQRDSKVELEAFSEQTGLYPHDDVTVFIVNERLVMIALWRNGAMVGMYYAIDLSDTITTEAGDEDDSTDGTTRATNRDRVCAILLDDCLNKRSENWVISCGLWLYFCSSN